MELAFGALPPVVIGSAFYSSWLAPRGARQAVGHQSESGEGLFLGLKGASHLGFAVFFGLAMLATFGFPWLAIIIGRAWLVSAATVLSPAASAWRDPTPMAFAVCGTLWIVLGARQVVGWRWSQTVESPIRLDWSILPPFIHVASARGFRLLLVSRFRS